ncbi:MAG: carboxypeptidase-like regulatory domain-containing protein [Bacteroidota bacterium]|jgi:hypothetical protein|nr:carboxypeptidase-like regulatory domain-containing protein [Bacteroidota bacterium]
MARYFLMLCGLVLACAVVMHAQLNVVVQMDPNPSPYISDWRGKPNTIRFIVTNPTSTEYEVRFTGYIEGDARGRVAETIDDSRIPPVPIPPGTSVLNAIDVGILDEGSVLYTGPTSEQTRRSGRLPEDNFRICMRLMRYGPPYEMLTPETCSRFAIRLIMPPTLIAPANTAEVKTTPGFQWSVVPMGTGTFARYELTVVELEHGQRNPAQALTTNLPLIQRETNLAMYQILPADPQLEKGKTYAWRVRALDFDNRFTFTNDGYSEIWTFFYDPPVPPGFAGTQIPGTTKKPGVSVKPDLSSVNTNPNFVFTGMTRLRGTLLTTFAKSHIPAPRSVTVHDPKPSTKPGSAINATPGGTTPAFQGAIKPAGTVKTIAAMNMGNVYALQMRPDLPLGGIHLTLYRNVRTVPVCGVSPYSTGGKYYTTEHLVATATTRDDGSFEFNFLAHDSTGRIHKDAQIHAGGSGDVGVCDFVGDIYRYYSIRVTDPHLCSPGDEFKLQPGGDLDVGTLYALVRSYHVTVQVSDMKDTTQMLSGMNVLLIRRTRPYDVPPTEGSIYPPEPAEFPHNSEIIGRGETDAYGLCTFKNVVKNVGGSDYYDLWITNPEESVYWYSRCWQTFRFGFQLGAGFETAELDELGNALPWDQAITNEEYDPDAMRAAVDARMWPRNPRVKGRVYRADNTIQPLVNTTVTLLKKTANTIIEIVTRKTNDSGGFVFDDLVPTEGSEFYYLRFEKFGYKIHFEPQDISVDKITLKKGRQRSFQKVLLTPKLVVRGKIIDEFGRPVAATVRIGTGENVHTTKKLKPIAAVPTQPILNAGTLQVNPNVQVSVAAQRVKFTTSKAARKLKRTPVNYDEVFSTPAPTGLQRLFIMPDNIALYHPDTLLVILPDGTEDIGDFVVYVKAHRLAVRAVAPPPPTVQTTPQVQRKSSRKTSQVQLNTLAQVAGSVLTQTQTSGMQAQIGINMFLQPLLAGFGVIHDCTITVNEMEPDSIDNSGVHYFVWFSPGDDAEVQVQGPPDRDFVPKTVATEVQDETPEWREMSIPLELGGRLSGTVVVGTVPVAGARVRLFDNPAETEPHQTYTDANGKYLLRGLRAEMHNFLAAKSKSQLIGDTASIEIVKGKESVLDFELTSYNDMDITTLLGFPIEVAALDSTDGAVWISGGFVEFPANAQFAPEDSSIALPFAKVTIGPSSRMNDNGIPYSEPSTLPLVTPTNGWDIRTSDGLYKVRQHDAAQGLRVRRNGDRGEIIGVVSIKPSSFTFPGGSLDLGSNPIALSTAPGNPEGLIIPAITSDAGPASTLPQGFHPLNEDGSALRFTLYDFPTACDSLRSYFRADTLSLATILHTNIETIANPDLAIDIGALRVHHDGVESIRSDEDMDIVLEGDWKLTARSWKLDQNGLSLDSGTIRAGFLGVPFDDIKILPDQIAYGSFEINRLVMSDAAEIVVTGKTQFGYDNGTKHWALSVAPNTIEEDECGWMQPVFPMDPGDRIRFNNFFIQSSGSTGFTMKPGAIVTLSKVGQYVINQFIPKEHFIQIAGSLDLGIPNLPMINQIGSILREDDETIFLLDAINETIAVNGVRIKFNTAKGQQDWQEGGLHSGVRVYEDGAFDLGSMLHHTPAKTEIIVNEGEVVDVGTEVRMTDVVGEMHVAENAWDLFWFEGDLQNDDQGGRLKFTVQGDIVASGQEIGVDKIETPFGDISLIYNFQEQQLEGTLHVEQDLDGTLIVGDATLLVSGAGKGWYFFCGASFTLPQPKVDGTAAFAVGHFKLTQTQLDQFAQYSYQNKELPPQFHNFNGFFFEGTVMVPPPVFCPNFDFDFGIVSAYMICQVGANARFGMNFGPVDTYFISIRGIGKLEAGVGMSVVIACAGVSAGILIEPNVEGMYQSDGTWYVLGDFPITLYGTTYAGWGICDSDCEGSLCDKESVSASITLGMKGYVGSDDKYFKFYFK